jgi:hypothetical protein
MNQWGSRPPITMTTLKESAVGNPRNDRRIGGGAAEGRCSAFPCTNAGLDPGRDADQSLLQSAGIQLRPLLARLGRADALLQPRNGGSIIFTSTFVGYTA